MKQKICILRWLGTYKKGSPSLASTSFLHKQSQSQVKKKTQDEDFGKLKFLAFFQQITKFIFFSW